MSISGSMEGSITISNGDFVAAGYSFTIPGSHPALMVLVANAVVTIHGTCSNGSPDNTITIPLRAGDTTGLPYSIPAGSSNWFPSNDEGAPESFQGSVVADICGGTGTLNASAGATFSADVQSNPAGAGINFRFHYRVPNAKGMGNVDCSVPVTPPLQASVCGASWSGTQSVTGDVIPPTTPTLTSTASGSLARHRRGVPRRRVRRVRALGGSITDTAHLTGGTNPTGTITFNLFGPADTTCSSSAVFSTTAAVSGNGNYTSTSFTPPGAGTYRWQVSYSGDSNNSAVGPTTCGDPSETVVVQKVTPTLSSTASTAVTVGGKIFDTAHLSGFAPTGTITFNLYGPNDSTCTGPIASTSTVTVNGNGDYPSASFTPTLAGTYRWIVSYSGDSNNDAPAPTSCTDTAEAVVVGQVQPTLTSAASGSVTLGSAISDTAFLAGGIAPTGLVTFTLYGPNDPTCTTVAFGPVTASVSGGTAQSGSFTPTAAGTYRWVVSYAGDTNNHAAGPTACGDPTETIDVHTNVVPTPTLTSSATSGTAGSPISDTAILAGGNNPTGQITFTLFGPNDATCSNTPVFTSSATATGAGSYSSGTFTPTQAGTYEWRVSYLGDTNNSPVPATACGAAGETATVARAQPSLSSTASGNVVLGGVVSDTADLTGGTSPAGTISWALYGPNDATCSLPPVFTATLNVTGSGTYPSPSFTPTAAGTYHWVVSYSGGPNNLPAGPTTCGVAGENVTVSRASPSIFSLASGATTRRLAANARAGQTGGRIGLRPRRVGRRFRAAGLPIHDVAHLSGGMGPTGFISFRLYGPNDASCSATPVFTDEIVVTANGDYLSGSFIPTATGTYRWVASYSGDDNNDLAGPTTCGDPAETVDVVLSAQPTLTTTASGAVDQGGPVSDTAHLSGGTNPTGTITFRLYGPDDASCSGAPAFTSPVGVSGNGDYSSGSFTPPAAGTYRWRATYTGDADNDSAGPTGCGANGETVDVRATVVTPATPNLSTTVPHTTASLGTPIYDVAHLSGGSTPTGTILFELFGPHSPSCGTHPVFTSQVSVFRAGSYPSASYVATRPGTYRWVASYSGDNANKAAGPTRCGDPAETVTISTRPSPDASPPVAPVHNRRPRPSVPTFTG
jgi:hypothetical protein